ncbi:hypothetical protein LX36DRAFT_336042 [Colletotrichum falcatum]|nr:hypothetical protein LX36DRAFT_336042 [Colletotrichum falcatum]
MDQDVPHLLPLPDYQVFWSHSDLLSFGALDTYGDQPPHVLQSSNNILLQSLLPQHVPGLMLADVPPLLPLDHIWPTNVAADSVNLLEHANEIANLFETPPLYECSPIRTQTNPPPTRSGRKRAYHEATPSDLAQMNLVTAAKTIAPGVREQRQKAQRQPQDQGKNVSHEVPQPVPTINALGHTSRPRPSASKLVDLAGDHPTTEDYHRHHVKKRLRSTAPASAPDSTFRIPQSTYRPTSPIPFQGQHPYGTSPPARVSKVNNNDADCVNRQHKGKQKEGTKRQKKGKTRAPVQLSSYQQHVMKLLDVIKRECH